MKDDIVKKYSAKCKAAAYILNVFLKLSHGLLVIPLLSTNYFNLSTAKINLVAYLIVITIDQLSLLLVFQ